MKHKILLLTLVLLGLLPLKRAEAQDAKEYYEKALEKAQEGNLEEAVGLFDKSIELKSDLYITWYNRGIVKSMLNLYESAFADFEKTIELNPTYKKGYLSRGTARKRLTDYEGAINDYSTAIGMDSNYAEAYYNRGLVYEMVRNYSSACSDFTKAMALGLSLKNNKLDKCKDTSTSYFKTKSILSLANTSDDKKYGFTSEKPVKVGTGPDGGPANNRAYLDLLRDANGKPVKYERKGSCCPYETENGLFGSGMLDKYEITFTNNKGKTVTATVFITFYDYEEPQILKGLFTVKKP